MGGSMGNMERHLAIRTALSDSPMVWQAIKAPGLVYPHPRDKPSHAQGGS